MFCEDFMDEKEKEFDKYQSEKFKKNPKQLDKMLSQLLNSCLMDNTKETIVRLMACMMYDFQLQQLCNHWVVDSVKKEIEGITATSVL